MSFQVDIKLLKMLYSPLFLMWQIVILIEVIFCCYVKDCVSLWKAVRFLSDQCVITKSRVSKSRSQCKRATNIQGIEYESSSVRFQIPHSKQPVKKCQLLNLVLHQRRPKVTWKNWLNASFPTISVRPYFLVLRPELHLATDWYRSRHKSLLSCVKPDIRNCNKVAHCHTFFSGGGGNNVLFLYECVY